MTTNIPDPKEVASSIRNACANVEESHKNLAPFAEAGWQIGPSPAGTKSLSGGYVIVNYQQGQFIMAFQLPVGGGPGPLYFDSAEEAIKYVNEIEQQLASK